ncbi:alpha/beta hydrolase [Roseimaritima sediminicola]|uniref:alpha/beta hydrolase n=1 Tax=Roseimaritima sediminicola TaxID=2662066 RepID=UPI00129857DA|nr:alpha/beta fold hydrolase [Roseimaritima sediminicola]
MRTRIADRVVLLPSTDEIEPGTQQRVELQAGPYGRIEAFVHAEQGLSETKPRLLVIKLPGTGGRAERSSQLPVNFLDEVHAEVWTWNPPGYGRSPGRASFANLPAAALDFFDAVVQRRRGEQTRVWVMGNSLGCASALYQASQRAVDGLILRNPPPLVQTIPHVALRHRAALLHPLVRPVARWISSGIPAEMDALETAPKCDMPAVFIQAECDTMVPPALQQLIRDAYAGEIRLVRWEGLEHHEMPEESQLEELGEAVGWLMEQCRLSLRESS